MARPTSTLRVRPEGLPAGKVGWQLQAVCEIVQDLVQIWSGFQGNKRVAGLDLGQI